MAISDEIASLSAQLQKLTTVVSNLVLARTLQGSFDMRTLPRESLIALKLDYLVKEKHHQQSDENPAPNSSCNLETLRGISQKSLPIDEVLVPCAKSLKEDVKVGDAHQVFDAETKDHTNISDAHKVLDEMPLPEFIREMAKTTNIEEEAVAYQVFDELPEPNLGSVNAPIVEASIAQKMFDKMPDQVISSNPLEASSIEYSIESRVLSAQKTFDELPLPDFIKELAETSRAIELNTIGGDYDYTFSVHEVEDDHSTHLPPLFTKLDVSDGSYLHNLVITNAKQDHFPMLQSLIFSDCPRFGQTPSDINADYAGNLCHEYPHFQEAYRWDKRTADFKRFVWNMVLELICSCRFVFDPGVFLMVEKKVELSLLTIFCELQNDWSTNVVYQELHTPGKLYVLDAIVGFDLHDFKATGNASKYIPTGGYPQLGVDGLRLKRLGIIIRHPFFNFIEGSRQDLAFKHFQTIRQRGAVLIDNLTIPNLDLIQSSSKEITVMLAGFKLSLDSYLKELETSPVRSLADIIEFNNIFSEEEKTEVYGQELFVQAKATKGIEDKDMKAITTLEKWSGDGFGKCSCFLTKAISDLKNLRPQLYSATAYCEKSYLHREHKQMVLDNLKDYTIRALVHLDTVAFKLTDLIEQQLTDLVEQQTADVSTMDELLKDSDIVVHVPVKPRKGHLHALENFNPLGFIHGLMEVGLITSVLHLIVLEKDLRVYVFDPGGRYMILEDKDHFMGWEMIQSEILAMGSLVILPYISYFPSHIVYIRVLASCNEVSRKLCMNL